MEEMGSASWRLRGPLPSPTRVARVNIVFVEPAFPANQRRFVSALADVGPRSIGVGESPEGPRRRAARPAGRLLPGRQRHRRAPARRGRPLGAGADVGRPARVDDRVAPDGRRAGARVARHTRHVRAHDLAVPRQALDEGGAAGGGRPHRRVGRRRTRPRRPARSPARSATRSSSSRARAPAPRAPTRVDSDDRARRGALTAFGDADSIAVEEFVEGHEGFYDTIAVGGHVVHDWATHYYPNVLEAMRHRWISPQFVTTNRIDQSPFYAEVREMGARVIEALGIDTSATHMEWFYGPKGLRFSEIGCRPPGVGAWDLYSAANDVDVYREWAHALVHGGADRPLSRRWSAGIVALRPDAGRPVHGYSGLDEIQRRHGEWIIDAHLPDPGTPTQPVEAGYMANAWVRMKHPDYDVAARHARRRRPHRARPRRMTPRVSARERHLPARSAALPHHRRPRRAWARRGRTGRDHHGGLAGAGARRRRARRRPRRPGPQPAPVRPDDRGHRARRRGWRARRWRCATRSTTWPALYGVRLHHALDAVYAVRRRTGRADVVAAAYADAVDALRRSTRGTSPRCARSTARPTPPGVAEQRPLREHRAEVAEELAAAGAGRRRRSRRAAAALPAVLRGSAARRAARRRLVGGGDGDDRTVVLFNDRRPGRLRGRGLGPRARPRRPHRRAAPRPPPAASRRPRAEPGPGPPVRGPSCLLLDDGAKVAVGPDGALPPGARVIGA